MHIAIVGAGTMGARIAQSAALGASEVILHDSDRAALRQALGRISREMDRGVQRHKIERSQARRARRVFRLAETLEGCANAAIVIEAVYDDLDLKRTVLSALDEIVPAETILATTTNTHPVGAIAAGTQRPERVVGLHFSKPAHIMRLVEVVRTERTPQDVLDRAVAFVRAIGKTPLVVGDTPGLVVNRVAQAYYGEALHLLDDGGLDVQTIDRLMESAGFPMGPFKLMDYLGVDTVFNLTRAIFNATYTTATYPPHPRLERMIDAGRAGQDGAGRFYPKPAAEPGSTE